MKIFQLSRALSIFRVNNVYIYHDKLLNANKNDLQFMVTILEYLDTPQYLRRKLYPKLEILKNVGKLHPIRSHHHKDRLEIREVKTGEIRVGVVEKRRDAYFVDVGLSIPIQYDGKFRHDGRKVNVKLLRHKNYISAIDIEKNEITELYWGYNLHQIRDLKNIIDKFPISNIILTSKHSKYFKPSENEFSKLNSFLGNNSILVVFGSPKFGLNSILSKEKMNISKYYSYNFFPNQGTQTVRLEESIYGVLSILNICLLFP
ncbi:MAG: RNA methyltransferase [Candidatus Nitrosocosmicus sp.]|nr:RNA methyltransferase [Candidatus Nitrosocosmicus sp.]